MFQPCLTYMETYRSGHNGTDSKSVVPHGTVGSNPTVSATKFSKLKGLLDFSFLHRLCRGNFGSVVEMGVNICGCAYQLSAHVESSKHFLTGNGCLSINL